MRSSPVARSRHHLAQRLALRRAPAADGGACASAFASDATDCASTGSSLSTTPSSAFATATAATAGECKATGTLRKVQSSSWISPQKVAQIVRPVSNVNKTTGEVTRVRRFERRI